MTSQQIREKTSARKVLAVLVGLLASLLALEGLASVRSGGAFEAFAQASPTGTGPTIELVNPDVTTSNEISAKPDGADSAYHLVAWVSQVPPNAAVEFKFTPSGDNQREASVFCQGSQSGLARFVAPDTFDCFWDLAGVTATGGTLRAILYSDGTPVASDEETVTITNGQTVEILYPTQAGEMGFYTQPNGTSIGRIDFTTSGSSGSGDEGTKTVVAYYSTSPPGTEPAFRRCQNATGRGNGDPRTTTGGQRDSVRCVLRNDDPDTAANENDDPSMVTAVALVARDITEGTPPGTCTTPGVPACDQPDPDSADAHRTFAYEQDPSSVTLDPQTQTAEAGRCSAVIKATVFDQNGRIVIGANVDVHAQGPTDTLAFDDDDASGNNTSRSKPPENGHRLEPTANCESTSTPPGNGTTNQGSHDRVPPEADIKHIESADAGTNDLGEFRFQLYSASAGSTQFTVWADEDANDQFCSAEAHGHGSIGWSQAPPSPTGVETEQTDCPKPAPGQTATPAPTATATATPTSTTTSTPTQSPTSTTTQAPTQCSDGQDNDGDGDVDMQDAGCDSPEDNDESDEQRNVVQNGPCAGFEQGSRQPKSDGSGVVIVGTPGPDDLRGGSGNDLICGLGGRDALRGRGGQDELYGGGGHDDIRGNAGNDYIEGNAGLDVLRGGRGGDIVKGGAQDDTIRAYVGRDRLVGGPGNDTLRGGRHNDRLFGNLGDDFLGGGAGFDRCNPGPGDDTRNGCER